MIRYSTLDQPMPLTEDDKKWISAKILSASSSPAENPPSPLPLASPPTHSLPQWLQNLLAIIVPCVGFAFWLGSLNSDVKHMQGDIGKVQSDLEKIETRLDTMQATAIKQRASIAPAETVAEISTANRRVFGLALPSLAAAISTDSAVLNDSSIQAISQRLEATDKATSEYWPTVLRFISAASSRLSSSAPLPGHGPTYKLSDVSISGFRFDHFPFNGGTLVLNGGTLRNVTILNSRIVFTERPVVLDGVEFIGCVFEFPDGITTPSPFIRDVATQLLAAGMTKPKIKT